MRKTISILVASLMVLSVFALNASAAGAAEKGFSWRWQYPAPQGNDLDDVYCISENEAWAVGEFGTMLHFDGGAWNMVESDLELDLYGIDGTGPENIWAVGDQGLVLHYDGHEWSPCYSDTGRPLRSIVAIDESNAWAVGSNGTMIGFDGSSWKNRSTGENSHYYDVDAADADHVWAVGETGSIKFFDGKSWSYQEVETRQKLTEVTVLDCENVIAFGGESWSSNNVALVFDGETWSSEPHPGGFVYDSCMLGAGTVLSVGVNGRICSTNDCANWYSHQKDLPAMDDLKGVSAAPDGTAWAVGNVGQLFRYEGGISWTREWNGIQEDVHDISAAAPDDVWAVAEGPGLLHFDGTEWCEVVAGYNGGTQYAVHALDGSHVWMAGQSGQIWFYDGSGWSLQASGTENTLFDVFALDPEHVWAVGAYGQVSFFNGSSWTTQDAGTEEYLYNIYAVTEDSVIATGAHETILGFNGERWTPIDTGFEGGAGAIYMAAEDDIWLARSEGRVLHFDGTGWSEHDTGTGYGLADIHGTGPDDIWAVGSRGAMVHYDGNSWERLDRTADKDLEAVTSAGPGLAWACGEEGSILAGQEMPAVDSLEPDSGEAGDTLAIEGSGFQGERGDSLVNFGSIAADEYISWTDNEIVCRVPAISGGGEKRVEEKVDVTVSTVAGDSEPVGFTFVYEPEVKDDPDEPDGRDEPEEPERHDDEEEGPAAWYLAEGTTAWGFDTRITIANPNGDAVNVEIIYMTEEGRVDGGTVRMPGKSSATVTPGDLLGQKDFSTRLECVEGLPIAVDRTMSWTGEGAPSCDFHSSIGVNEPATTWYLPEGSSAWGFETWLLVQNPGDEPAECTITYMVEDEGPRAFVKRVPANSRATFGMAGDIGERDASIKLDSSVPVIAERSMYRDNRRSGHDSIGATTPAKDYYLAEGTTGHGFTTYILVQNPNPTDTEVSLTYMTAAGPVDMEPFVMPPGSRKTVRVNEVLPDTDFSTRVTGSNPILAERAMYWGGGSPLGEACHDSIGMDRPHSAFVLPDGRVEEGVETYTLVQNPNEFEVRVEITYMNRDGEGNEVVVDVLPPNSRKTYSMREHCAHPEASVMVKSLTEGGKIMVERATYFNDFGAGACTIGGYMD